MACRHGSVRRSYLSTSPLAIRHSTIYLSEIWQLRFIYENCNENFYENGKNENPSKIEIKTKKIETFELNANLDSKAQSSWTVVHKKVKKSTSERTQLNSHAKFPISLKTKFINLISRVLFQFSSFQLYYLTLPFPKISIDYFRLV